MSTSDTWHKSNGRTSARDWDAYWAHGNLTSCANAFTGNYEGPIRETWEAFFSGLPKGARVLDIATGNGAVAFLAAEFSQRHQCGFEVHGIDRARIDPAGAWQGDPGVLAAIRFHGQVSAESTPFGDGFFQAVTGQYALEYTDCSATIRELARVMSPGARARFVLHHPDSTVMATSREERRHGRLLFEDTRIFDKAEALLQRIIPASTPAARRRLAGDPDAEAARAALNEAAARVTEAIEASPEPDLLTTALGYIGKAIRDRDRLGPEATLGLLEQGRQEISANLARLADLLSAVVDQERMALIRRDMGQAGITSEPAQLLFFPHENRKLLMGWRLDCRRDADN